MYQPEIIYEDNEIIVCRKPAGLAVQTSKMREQDLENLLKSHLAQISRQAGNPYLAVIHRLDQNVEGLLVFAKTPLAAKELNRQMQSGGFTKEYIALLDGMPAKSDDVLTDFLLKDGKQNISKVVNAKTPGAKKAILTYHLLTASELNDLLTKSDVLTSKINIPSSFTPVKVKLDTGRHHQIRVQMANLGHPIAGDTKYGDTRKSTIRLTTIALCAFHLSFKHPCTNDQMNFFILPAFLTSESGMAI